MPKVQQRPRPTPTHGLLFAPEHPIFAPLSNIIQDQRREFGSLFSLDNPVTDTAQLHQLVEPYLNQGEYYVVDIQVTGLEKTQTGLPLKVTVLVDADAGITIDACASISRQLGNDLDEQDFFGETPFTLEVSSPGVDFPLTSQRQFARNIGRSLNVKLANGSGLIGLLTTVDETGIVLDVPAAKMSKTKRKTLTELPPEGIQTIPYTAIQQATVEITF